MVAPTLNNFEYQFGDSGLKLNSTSTAPFFDVTSIAGLSQPEYRVTIKNREGFDGGYVDARYKNPRSIVIEFIAYLDSTLQDLTLDQLRYNFRPVDEYLPFYFKHPGIDQRICLCKVVGFDYNVTRERGISKVNCVASLVAGDPTFYDSTTFSADFSPFTAPTNGLVFDVTFDANFGGTTASVGFLSVTNYGNSIAYPTFTVPAGTGTPRIENQTVGSFLHFNAGVPATSNLIIDNRARSAVLENGANFRVFLVPGSSWIYLVPGSNNLFYSTGSGSGNLIVSFRNSWE